MESASDYIAKADQQAPSQFESVTSSAANNCADSSGAVDKRPVRPAAAAATASLIQSIDRSGPISLGLFGEDSYEDPVLELPGQAMVQGAAIDLQQGAVPSSPRRIPSTSAESKATTSEQAASRRQSNTPQHEFKPHHAFPPQFEFQAEHDFEPSWQDALNTDPPIKSSSTFMPDAADDADDFSPSWQQAGQPEGSWQNETAPEDPLPTATAFQSPHAFAATWPPLMTDADSASRQQLPTRQALSGPISLELFDMEEQEDQPLEVPTEGLTNALSAPQSHHAAAVDGGQRQLENVADPQQLAAAWHSESTQQSVMGRQHSPGPISLELFGMEETQDAPLELPVQATITVLPTTAPDASTSASLSLPTGTFSLPQSSSLV